MTGMLTGVLADLATAGRPGRRKQAADLGDAHRGRHHAGGVAYAQAPRLAPLIPLAPIACAIAIAASTLSGPTGARRDPSDSGKPTG